MKRSDFINSEPIFIEIGHSSLKALRGASAWEQQLERGDNGRLSDACKDSLVSGLKAHLERQSWQPCIRGFCAIGARGVSFRRLTLPSTTKAQLPQMLRLQIESEFPLPPEQLAWGYRVLVDNRSFSSSTR